MLFNNKNVLKTKIHLDFFTLKVCVVCNKKTFGTITCIINRDLREISIIDIVCENINMGYGTMMLEALIRYARRRRFKYIDGALIKEDYDHKERLYHFFQKFGFEIIQNQDEFEIAYLKDEEKFADIKLKLR